MGHVESKLVAGSTPSLLLGLPRHTVTEGRSIAMGRLDNKVAVITGAASGIGRSTAIRFAAEGSAVVVADLNIDGGGFDKPQSIGFPAAQAALPAWVHFMTNSVREPSLGFGPPPPGIAAKRRKRADFVVLRG